MYSSVCLRICALNFLFFLLDSEIFAFLLLRVCQTRMQSLRPHPVADYRGVGHAVKTIVQMEGMRAPFRGLSVVMVGAGPAHALYFGAYETVKRSLSPRNPGNNSAVNSE